jgi:DNA-binding NtrC family response regulator
MANTKDGIDILLVDDDEALLVSMADLLLDLGYKVKGFPDADSALSYAMDGKFKIGIFDYKLGGLKNGLDVVENLHMLGCKAVYMMITADVASATRMRAAHLNLFAFINKPVDPAYLVQTLENAVKEADRLAA